MRKLFGIALILLFFSGISFAEDIVQVDNQYIQEYRGRLGVWTSIGSQAQLNFYLHKYYTNLKDFNDINGNSFVWGDFVFIPYSKKYMQELEAQGVKRDSIESQKSDFIWPLLHVESISSTFGQRNGKLHTGTDMPATRGTLIVAVMDGRVLSTGYDSGNGYNVYIEHRDGFYTRYAHCSKMIVKAGDYVKKGQVIGMVGSTGNSTGNHLHFEIRYNDIPLNPLDFLPQKENLIKPHMIRSWK